MYKNRITNSEYFMELRKKLDEFSLGRIKGAMENVSVVFPVQECRSFPAPDKIWLINLQRGRIERNVTESFVFAGCRFQGHNSNIVKRLSSRNFFRNSCGKNRLMIVENFH